MNQGLKNLSQWLKANKLSLNVKKTELIIFYLGTLLDEHLLWTKQVNWVNSKLNQTIGILSKLRYNTNLPILKIVYHSLFGSHLQYGAQLWGEGNCVNQNIIQTFRTEHSGKLSLKNPMILLNPFIRT